MITKTFSLILLYFFLITPAHSAQLEEMQLVGAGQAYYLKFIKLYNASLYTDQPLEDANILSSTISKCLLLEYEVSISSKDFIKAANTILQRQFTEKQLEEVQGELNILHSNYRDVKDGDTYTLCYDKDKMQTILSHNMQEMVRIDSVPFAEIYFSIWLGNKLPLDKKLRDNLLAIK